MVHTDQVKIKTLRKEVEMFLITEGNHGNGNPGEGFLVSCPFKLLSMANEFEKAGILSYAVELYMKIIDAHPDTFEAVASKFALFLIASRYELEGRIEEAISIIRKINKPPHNEENNLIPYEHA